MWRLPGLAGASVYAKGTDWEIRTSAGLAGPGRLTKSLLRHHRDRTWRHVMIPPMSHAATTGPEPKRRDLLSLVATAGTVIGTCAVIWPFIDFMEPSKDVVAAGV